jgi:multicomponent Na+:H+ antiporter subunit F
LEHFYLGLALFLGLNLASGLVRIVRGPTPADRMLAAQLFGTTGVAILILLGVAGDGALLDVALVFAVLAALNAVVFVRLGVARQDASGERSR